MRVNFLKGLLFSGIFGGVSLVALAKSTDVRSLEDFDELEISNGVSVTLQKCAKSESPEAKVEVDGIETTSVTTKSKGQGLLAISIKPKPENIEFGAKVKKQKATIILKYKSLKKIKLKGASSCTVDSESELKSKDLELIADGGAKFEGKLIIDNELKLTAKSGAKLKLSGSAKYSVVECSGTCNLDMSNLESKNMELAAATGSTVKVSVTSEFKGSINSLAKLFLSGQPKKFELSRGSLAIVKFTDEVSDDESSKETQKGSNKKKNSKK